MNPAALVANGDFSRAIQMSVKVLRHYHQIGYSNRLKSIAVPAPAATAPTRSQWCR
jgi:hypothetical protein